MKGLIKGTGLEYVDSNTIKIKTGYGDNNGNYWEITSDTNHDMTSLASGQDFHYIYIDDSASSYPTPTIIDSTTEPSWSDAKQGWYNGDDRCIGAVWSPSSSMTLHEFQYVADGNKYYFTTEMGRPQDGANPNGTWQDISSSDDYSPVNAGGILVQSANSELDADSGTCIVRAKDIPYSQVLERVYKAYINGIGWIDFKRGDSRLLQSLGEDDDASNYDVIVHGYKIER